MRNICMTVSYDGTAYNGFQVQPGLNTIQGHLEHSIKLLTGEDLKITASGRTDAGVHARYQVFNFITQSQIPLKNWCLAVNTRLPDDIRVWSAMEVPLEFHSRRSAKRKTYRYTIRHGRYPNLFLRHLEYHHYAPLDVEAMREGLQHLVGEHDFTSYCSPLTAPEKSRIRTIYEARIECEPVDPAWNSYAMHIYLTGNGFLYNMVRIIVGTLLQVGQGKRSSEEMRTILEGKSRKLAGPTAVAHGLMLWEVFYDEQANSP
ncbi:tRNA pseudouridine(38-40) synthase TruA [Paenibacillus silviterrae]|uniref:tRNA pseudouridine(38-40) synthase TruA n=1 Tax=Paenibacillus silviterrae TaxID=3242194 RepID=UPI00254339F1|nr:tRNA pseudouridine(38-40) synthase TruA [Paenibacillus chinjuensis]